MSRILLFLIQLQNELEGGNKISEKQKWEKGKRNWDVFSVTCWCSCELLTFRSNQCKMLQKIEAFKSDT